jgi:hypothetical protein
MLKEFLKRFHWKQTPKQVKIDVINAIELRRDSTYILVADQRHVARDDIMFLMSDMRKSGIRNVVGFMLSGSPEESIQFVQHHKRDRKRGSKSNATTKTSY